VILGELRDAVGGLDGPIADDASLRVVPTVATRGLRPALVIRSLLEAEGITTSLDDWPITTDRGGRAFSSPART
jgi:hypothetical protein